MPLTQGVATQVAPVLSRVKSVRPPEPLTENEAVAIPKAIVKLSSAQQPTAAAVNTAPTDSKGCQDTLSENDQLSQLSDLSEGSVRTKR